MPHLDTDQLALLTALVDAQHARAKAQRSEFYFLRSFGAAKIQHVDLPQGELPAIVADVEYLEGEGLLERKRVFDGGFGFVVSRAGIEAERTARGNVAEASTRLEEDVRRWLNADAFIRRYPAAYHRWVEAETRLRAPDALTSGTTIGHLCREALQEFAVALERTSSGQSVVGSPANTVSRLKAAVKVANLISRTTQEFVDALIAYWGTVSDLVQRQEHGGQKESQVLGPDDARRVVFHTAIVMFEVDKAVGHRGGAG